MCEHKIPVWTPEQILKEHAWALGFFDNPAHQEELSALLQKSSVALAHCGAAGDEQCRQPRGGVSLGRELDKFFDRFLAPYSVNQMSTERALSKLKFSIGKVGVINEETVNFRLYKDNDLKNKLDVAWLKEVSCACIQVTCSDVYMCDEAPFGGTWVLIVSFVAMAGESRL